MILISKPSSPTQVMVEIANGFKIGIVKFIGETEFSPGEWVGVALERPNGEAFLYTCFITTVVMTTTLCPSQASTMEQ